MKKGNPKNIVIIFNYHVEDRSNGEIYNELSQIAKLSAEKYLKNVDEIIAEQKKVKNQEEMFTDWLDVMYFYMSQQKYNVLFSASDILFTKEWDFNDFEKNSEGKFSPLSLNYMGGKREPGLREWWGPYYCSGKISKEFCNNFLKIFKENPYTGWGWEQRLISDITKTQYDEEENIKVEEEFIKKLNENKLEFTINQRANPEHFGLQNKPKDIFYAQHYHLTRGGDGQNAGSMRSDFWSNCTWREMALTFSKIFVNYD